MEHIDLQSKKQSRKVINISKSYGKIKSAPVIAIQQEKQFMESCINQTIRDKLQNQDQSNIKLKKTDQIQQDTKINIGVDLKKQINPFKQIIDKLKSIKLINFNKLANIKQRNTKDLQSIKNNQKIINIEIQKLQKERQQLKNQLKQLQQFKLNLYIPQYMIQKEIQISDDQYIFSQKVWKSIQIITYLGKQAQWDQKIQKIRKQKNQIIEKIKKLQSQHSQYQQISLFEKVTILNPQFEFLKRKSKNLRQIYQEIKNNKKKAKQGKSKMIMYQ